VSDVSVTLAALKDAVQAFCEARDWDQFHGPRDLAIGIVTEAAELLDRFRFKDDTECAALLADSEGRDGVEHELADTLFFILRFAQRNGIDLSTALERKMALNAERYPVAKARGSNRKYTEL
jgi:NTP pyrophosphatase (non-canonical NTP hydrolase)